MRRTGPRTAHDLLSRATLFAQVERAVLDKALGAAVERSIDDGAVLFRQGALPERLYLVAEGQLKMTRLASDGSQLTIGILGPGEIAGCVAALRNLPYPATALALSRVKTLSWSRAQFDQMLKQSPQLGRNALEIVGSRAERFLGRVHELTKEPAARRVARALLQMLDRGGRRADALVVTRQQLADIAGVTLHTASRVIAELARRGIVKGGRQRIEVVNLPALAAIVDGKKE